ncbi:MAG: hypothetical protein PVH61_10535 [Candidatus Aminicenantes bacterium]|jgi:hypothetical protein
MKFAVFTIKEHDIWEKLWEKVKNNTTVKFFNLLCNKNELIEISGEIEDLLTIDEKAVHGFFFKQEDSDKTFKIAVINQFGNSGDEGKEANTTGVKLVINRYKDNDREDNIFIGEHKTGGRISHDDEEIKKYHIGSFQHEVKGDKIYEAIEKFVEKLDIESFEKLCEAIKKKTLIPDFAILRQQISHLWLPLYLDFQQLIKITDIKKRLEYANQVIQEYRENQDKENNHPFLQLLADFNLLVTGAKKTAGIDTSLSRDILPGEKPIKVILKEAELEFKKAETFIKNASLKKFLDNLDKANTPVKFLDIIDKGVNNFNAREFNEEVSNLDKNLTELEKKLK